MSKKVCYIPEKHVNKSVALFREGVKEAGYDLLPKNNLINILQCDIIHFNWFESVSNDNKIKAYGRYYYNMLLGRMSKLLKKRIVFTLNNIAQLDGDKFGLSTKLLKWILVNSDCITIHCYESIKVVNKLYPYVDTNKMVYLPHPSYYGAYNDRIKYTKYHKKGNEFVILTMGLIRPYKNIESVIEVANSLAEDTNIHFLICGESIHQEYSDKLISMAKADNITFDFRYVADDEIPSLMENVDCFLLPYNIKASLNSGVAYLAFSFGKTLISTTFGTIKDIQNLNLTYTFNLQSSEDNLDEMRKAILEAYHDYSDHREEFNAKGAKLKRIMDEDHSMKKISEAFQKAYQ